MLRRRTFLASLAALSALPARAALRGDARIAVIGGGFGGATCAKYLRRLSPSLEVTLFEPKRRYATCPFSNLALAGLRDLETLTQDYRALARHGIEVLHERVGEIDPVAGRLITEGGRRREFDFAVVAPGIDFRWDAVDGYDPATAQIIPHAWEAGAQTHILREQLRGMPDGGTFLMGVPGDPFRCPPGPYERASLVAHYLQAAKPRSKILILDTKDKFSKQALFVEAWQALYPDMIEWIPGSEGGRVEKVDAKGRALVADSGFTTHKADVINFIPPQKAGAIAAAADLVDETGWCPVRPESFESTRYARVHVIGDACLAGLMPKSAFSANSQAKVCAAAIAAAVAGSELPTPSYANTCYSLVAPDYAISISDVYRLQDGQIKPVPGAGGLSPEGAPAAFRREEARYARGWYDSITADTFS